MLMTAESRHTYTRTLGSDTSQTRLLDVHAHRCRCGHMHTKAGRRWCTPGLTDSHISKHTQTQLDVMLERERKWPVSD